MNIKHRFPPRNNFDTATGVNWKRIQFCKEQLSRHSCDNADSSLNVSKTQKPEAGTKLTWCCRRLGRVRLWWFSTTWTRTGTRGRSGWARPTATRSLSAPASKRYFFQFLREKGNFWPPENVRFSSLCFCSWWSESFLLLQRSPSQTPPSSNHLERNRSQRLQFLWRNPNWQLYQPINSVWQI